MESGFLQKMKVGRRGCSGGCALSRTAWERGVKVQCLFGKLLVGGLVKTKCNWL